MRRSLLITAFVLLLLLDLMLVPFGVTLIYLAVGTSSIGLPGSGMLPLGLLGLAFVSGLVFLTVVVFRAMRDARTSGA